MKRSSQLNLTTFKRRRLDPEFIKKCRSTFRKSKANIMARNSVVTVGSLLASTDTEECKKVSHVFLNTIKKKNVKATNQGYSGRCWMFAGLNVFRHSIIHALHLENFEFSETYLYFWDKFERCNSYIQWFIDNLHNNYEVDDRYTQHILADYMCDGGWWNTFTNLVEKYGVVPKSAMPETYQSDYSDDMNNIIAERLHACIIKIFSLKKKRKSQHEIYKVKEETLHQLYNVLVKFLGEPPKKFQWSYVDENDKSMTINGLTSTTFKELIMPNLNIKDFVVLCNAPNTKYMKKYCVEATANVAGGDSCSFVNVPSSIMKKYAKRSILSGMPVWFAGDVHKGFQPMYSALDDKLINTNLVFGDPYETTKGERLVFRDQEGNHAMTLIGINVDDNDDPINWQVENSWGYHDNETLGEDGFMSMSDQWFDDYVVQIAVHKNYLPVSILKLFDSEPVILKPWNSMAPALKVKPVKPHPMFMKKNKLMGVAHLAYK